MSVDSWGTKSSEDGGGQRLVTESHVREHIRFIVKSKPGGHGRLESVTKRTKTTTDEKIGYLLKFFSGSLSYS